RNRLSPPNGPTNEEAADGSPPGRAHHAEAAAEVSPAAGGEFVTDWQLHDEPRPSSHLPFDREDIDDGGGRDGEDFDDEDFDDSEEEDAEDEEPSHADRNGSSGEGLDALYVDIGGEG